ncbi:MAG: response regulator [Desulfobacterales bacterium]|nr:response regulator [Desulfobacterales bacterium]
MSDGLDVIVIDDDLSVCEIISEIIKRFYVWGDVLKFSNVREAKVHCLSRKTGIAIFVLDVFLKGESGFYFLDAISEKYPSAYQDTIIITGNASDDVVDMCIASDVSYLLEKPVKPYALQLAVRAIAQKYLQFAKRLMEDPVFADNVSKF